MNESVTFAVLIVVIVALASIMFYYLKTGVTPVPSTQREIATVVELLRRAGIRRDATIYDLGCGWGSLLVGLARAFPEARVVGFEISPLPYFVAKLRARGSPRMIIARQDYRRAAIADADAVTAYLAIKPMVDVAALLDRQLRPGALVVTLCFSFRGRAAQAVAPLPALGQASLYIWPARPPPSPGSLQLG